MPQYEKRYFADHLSSQYSFGLMLEAMCQENYDHNTNTPLMKLINSEAFS
jgi:hypothetical protein